MEYKTLSSGFKLPVIGLGTWGIGGKRESDYSCDEESIEILKKAISLGYTHIDTAEVYGLGHSEELVGKAIKDFNREDICIVTKVAGANLGYDDLIAACKASLKRLDTDYIDVYLIHWPNSDIPIEETMGALNYLVDKGMIKHIGVSNFQVEQLREAQKFSKHKIVCNQIEYSLATRNKGRYAENENMESETVPYCQEQGIMIVAERPVERGLLLKPHPTLDALEKKYGKTKAQIAINWLISKENVVTIPKSSNVDHLVENLGAMGWIMDEEDIKLLDETDFSDRSA